MGFFTIGGRRRASDISPHPDTLIAARDVGFLQRFEAVGEALLAEQCPLAACDTVGREMALDGASAPEALSRLRETFLEACGQEPSFDAVQALVVAWSETTLSAVNQISCSDPMTGLASLPHLSSVLQSVFRAHQGGAQHPRDTHALVVLDLSTSPVEDPLGRALSFTRLGEAVRTVFAHGEPVARAGAHRVVALVRRDERLGARVRLLRRLSAGLDLGGISPRVWIEGLPTAEPACALLIDELARS